MSIKIGSFILHAPINGKMWIVNLETGDGGSFPVEQIEALIKRYYEENF